MKKHQKILFSLGVAISFTVFFSFDMNAEGTISETPSCRTKEILARVGVSPGAVDRRLVNSTSFTMRYVPAGGTLVMGEPVEPFTQEVTVTRNFWMGEVEVTQGLWDEIWGSPWVEIAKTTAYGVSPEYPVYFVTWYEIVAYCNLLTRADNAIANKEQVYYSDPALTLVYTKENAAQNVEVYVDWSKKGYRLPTEGEWEYSARYIDGVRWNHGNHVSGDTEFCCVSVGCSHPFAKDTRISEYAWWYGTNGSQGDINYKLHAVRQKKANALGLYDMSGNVWEWCHDWYAPYQGESVCDSKGPEFGQYRVCRGGYWYSLGKELSCAVRFNHVPGGRKSEIGFRLCRTAE